MKRSILTLCAAAMAALLVSGKSDAAQTADATEHVYVTVAPIVSVSVLGSDVHIPDITVGEFTADVGFRVDANVESLSLGVATTALYKAGDPTSLAVPPLKVDQTIGATITAEHANPLRGASNVAQYGATAINYNGFAAFRTNDIPFESSQNGRFSQDVNVHVGWQQTNPEQPQGEYSGYVVLYAALVGTD